MTKPVVGVGAVTLGDPVTGVVAVAVAVGDAAAPDAAGIRQSNATVTAKDNNPGKIRGLRMCLPPGTCDGPVEYVTQPDKRVAVASDHGPAKS